MKVLVPGHRYELDNLKDEGKTILQFYSDPHIHGLLMAEGPSCQEVLRAIIDRVKTLDTEKPWELNQRIVELGREMIALFEARALILKTQKGVPIDELPVGPDGHLIYLTKK